MKLSKELKRLNKFKKDAKKHLRQSTRDGDKDHQMFDRMMLKVIHAQINKELNND